MTKLFATASLCLLATGCATATKLAPTLPPGAQVVKKDEASLVGSFKVKRYVLGNGLKLLVLEDHSSPTFAYQTWFNVGSHDEKTGRTGLAHLFEHLMFKATSHHPEGEFDKILEGAGVENENAFTSWDYTAYVQELPKEKLELIAQLESDRMVNLIVNDASFKTEREVVQNERRFRNENSPEGIMFQDLFELAFAKHSYHWPIIGYQEDLAAMAAQDARNFYHAYYSPNHAVIAVVGDVDPDQVLATVQKYYGNLSAQQAPAHSVPEEPAQSQVRRNTVPLNIQVEKLTLGYHMPAVTSGELSAFFVLDALLSGGKSSRLQRALVDTGIASSIGTSVMEQEDPSLFIFESDLQSKRKATLAENVILRELSTLSREPVPAAELVRAKNRIKFSFYQGLEGSSEKASFLGRYETLFGDFEKGTRIQELISSVTPEQVMAVALKYFLPNQRTVVTGVRQ